MKQYIFGILLTLGACLFVGCTCGESAVTEPDAQPIMIAASDGPSFQPQAFSRAGETHPDVPGLLPETVGLFVEMQGYTNSIMYNQIVYHKLGTKYADPEVQAELTRDLEGYHWPADNNWVYAPLKYWSGNRDYQLYCYAPHSSIEGTSVNLTSTKYGAISKFEITGIPPYSSYDYMVASQYKFQRQGTVPFSMRHVSARVRLRMRIGRDYSLMRRVKVTNVTVNDRVSGGSYHNCEVDLYDDPTQNAILTQIGNPYQPSSPNAEVLIIPIFEDADGLMLSPDEYQEFGSLYVMPQDITTLTVNVTYDVYDMDSDVPTRPAQRVTNTVSFSNPTTGENYISMLSGKYYDINIVVSPKYLYVLSDNDQEPDILISPE